MPKSVLQTFRKPGFHAFCREIQLPDHKTGILKVFNLKNRLNEIELISLEKELKAHIADLENAKIPVPFIYKITSYYRHGYIITIDDFIPGKTVYERVMFDGLEQEKYLKSVVDILIKVCSFKKELVTLMHNTDAYISVDPILANFIISDRNNTTTYIDFFVPKVRTLNGDFNFFENLHTIDKDHMNYIHFNKVGIFHHFYKRNEQKLPGIGPYIYNIYQRCEFLNDLLTDCRLDITCFNKSYNEIMDFLELPGYEKNRNNITCKQ